MHWEWSHGVGGASLWDSGGGLPPLNPPGCPQVKGSQTMNVISAIFALLGIVAFIVDLNLNGLYRSNFNYYSYLIMVKSCLTEFQPLGTPLGLFSSPQGVLCPFPNPCWGGGFFCAAATYFRLVPREMSHPLEASMSHKNGGMEGLE